MLPMPTALPTMASRYSVLFSHDCRFVFLTAPTPTPSATSKAATPGKSERLVISRKRSHRYRRCCCCCYCTAAWQTNQWLRTVRKGISSQKINLSCPTLLHFSFAEPMTLPCFTCRLASLKVNNGNLHGITATSRILSYFAASPYRTLSQCQSRPR